jgi:hypothetical protein
MKKNSINSAEFEEWRDKTEIEYAAETIQRNGIMKRLKFLVNLSGKFRVIFKGPSGEGTLYEGYDFVTAVKTYIEA